MRYLGGKGKLARRIAAEIERVRPPGSPYWEPFVGGCNVIPHVSGERYASDSNAALITTYNAYQADWRPPDNVTPELYAELKAKQDPRDPLTAFVGFGHSFGGKWFAGYVPANDKDGHPARSLARKLAACAGVPFVQLDYREADPVGCTIYADPPYSSGTQYAGVAAFDSGEFFDWARRISRRNALLISEYEAPSDFVCVWETQHHSPMDKIKAATRSEITVERLFRWRGGVN